MKQLYKMPNPEVANIEESHIQVIYSKKKKKLRLDAIREGNGKFDEKLAWAQDRGYKKGDNRYELDYFLREHALYEGFQRRSMTVVKYIGF